MEIAKMLVEQYGADATIKNKCKLLPIQLLQQDAARKYAEYPVEYTWLGNEQITTKKRKQQDAEIVDSNRDSKKRKIASTK